MYLAYQWVAVAVMLAEANYCGQQLALPEKLPITREHVKLKSVAPADMMDFGGRLDTDRYSYCFLRTGRLRYIVKLDPWEGLTHLQACAKLVRTRSLIGTNEAFQIATNWLARVSVNVRELETTNPVQCSQEVYWDPATDLPKAVPIFDVTWGNPNWPIVSVCIDGRSRELIFLRQDDDSFSGRPAKLIRDREALISISDQEFLSYSASRRQRLVARYSAVSYSKPETPAPQQDTLVSPTNHPSSKPTR